jgi:hypothetical protein
MPRVAGWIVLGVVLVAASLSGVMSLRWYGPEAALSRAGGDRRRLMLSREDGRPPREARFATASIARDFDRSGLTDTLYAVAAPFDEDGYGFPSPQEPIQNLYLLSADPEVAAAAPEAMERGVDRLSEAELPYRLSRQNSNSALGCLIRLVGAPPERIERMVADRLLRSRLPGIGAPLWEEATPASIAECVAAE